jgi:hypothetical protein
MKSPFLIYRNFLSIKACEQIVEELDFYEPDYDNDDKPMKTVKHDEKSERIIYNRFENIIPEIDQYYNTQYQGMHHILFEYFTPGTMNDIHCENSIYVKNAWRKVKHRDLSAILFMSDYHDDVHFDVDFDVYGGKLEFAQYDFSFNPERGTLIIFPSDPWFLNATSTVNAGELVQARIQMTTAMPFIYNIEEFPGSPSTWFADLD